MKSRSMAQRMVGLAAGCMLAGQVAAQEAAAVEADAPVAEVAPAVVEAAPVAVEAVPAAAPEIAAPAVEAAPAAAAGENAGYAVPSDNVPEGSKSETGLITVSLDDVELADVVRLFTRLSGANIICNTTNLTGSVTANLQDVEWQPAFKAILERQGLLLVEDPRNKGIFYVDTQAPDAPEPWVTETFPLEYLKSSEAAEMLKSMLGVADTSEKSTAPIKAKAVGPDGEPVKEDVAVVFRKEGRVVSYPAGNMVVVSTTEAKMEEIRTVLKRVDVPRQQVYIEAKIVELSGADSKKIGIDWSMLDGYEVTAGPFVRDYEKTQTREGGSANYAVQERAASYNDAGRRMSTADGGVTVGSAAALTPVAVAITPGSDYAGVEGAVTPGASTLSGWNAMAGRFTSISDIRSAVFSADALSLVLSALQTSDDAFLVSNPKVIVANEEKAIIDMTMKTPYITIERTAGTEESPGDKFASKISVIPGDNDDLAYIEQAFFTSGLKLDVTPRINNPSNITIIVEPTISTASRYKTTTMSADGEIELDTGYPEIQMKRVKTTFSLGDGQTAVIGGLTQTRDRDVIKKVPLLGDIPLIGKYLFSHQTKEKQQIETIIFVTVGIIDPTNPSSALQVPEASQLIQNRVDPEGRLIKPAEETETVEAVSAAE